MREDAIIQANDIYKTYDTGKVTIHALNGINLEVKRGEMVAVMGPSGCGKTTLLNTLSGLDNLDKGMIRIDGQDLAQMNDKERTSYRAANMGFIFQFYNLLPVLTAVENVEMPLLLDTSQRISTREARQRAIEALQAVGLTEQADQLPAELSGGQRQRVTIARALVNQPAIVWADEPTGDLDSKTSKEIIDLMRTLNRENGQTFVLVTHSEDIGRQMDRTIWMRDGLIEKRSIFSESLSISSNGYGNEDMEIKDLASADQLSLLQVKDSLSDPDSLFQIAVEPIIVNTNSENFKLRTSKEQ